METSVDRKALADYYDMMAEMYRHFAAIQRGENFNVHNYHIGLLQQEMTGWRVEHRALAKAYGIQ